MRLKELTLLLIDWSLIGADDESLVDVVVVVDSFNCIGLLFVFESSSGDVETSSLALPESCFCDSFGLSSWFVSIGCWFEIGGDGACCWSWTEIFGCVGGLTLEIDGDGVSCRWSKFWNICGGGVWCWFKFEIVESGACGCGLNDDGGRLTFAIEGDNEKCWL